LSLPAVILFPGLFLGMVAPHCPGRRSRIKGWTESGGVFVGASAGTAIGMWDAHVLIGGVVINFFAVFLVWLVVYCSLHEGEVLNPLLRYNAEWEEEEDDHDHP
jgi:hypothetical protein